MKGDNFSVKVQKIDNVRENPLNFKRESDLNRKSEITLPKNKSHTAQFRAVLDDVVLKGVKK